MEVLPSKDGLLHASELTEGRTENVEDIVKKGDVITAKRLGMEEKGRVKMPRHAWLWHLFLPTPKIHLKAHPSFKLAFSKESASFGTQ
jgi:hypothetical protein